VALAEASVKTSNHKKLLILFKQSGQRSVVFLRRSAAGKTWVLVEDTGLGTIGTEWDLVHIPVNSKQTVSSVVMCFAYA